MTLYEIEILSHIHCSNKPHKSSSGDLYQETIKKFRSLCVIEVSDGAIGWKLTRLGRAWLMAIERVQCPTIAYVDSEGTVLVPEEI